MTRGDHTFVVCLLASLLAHGAILGTMISRLQPPAAPLATASPRPRSAGIFFEESKDEDYRPPMTGMYL